jgi:hypothetical protein
MRVPHARPAARALEREIITIRGPLEHHPIQPGTVPLGPRLPFIEPGSRAATAAWRTDAGNASDPRRTASSGSPDTLTARSLPANRSRTGNPASRRSVSTRSPDPRGTSDGAATTHSSRRRTSSRAGPYPVGPASYPARTGPGNAKATIHGVSERLRPKIRHIPNGSGRAYA